MAPQLDSVFVCILATMTMPLLVFQNSNHFFWLIFYFKHKLIHLIIVFSFFTTLPLLYVEDIGNLMTDWVRSIHHWLFFSLVFLSWRSWVDSQSLDICGHETLNWITDPAAQYTLLTPKSIYLDIKLPMKLTKLSTLTSQVMFETIGAIPIWET